MMQNLDTFGSSCIVSLIDAVRKRLDLLLTPPVSVGSRFTTFVSQPFQLLQAVLVRSREYFQPEEPRSGTFEIHEIETSDNVKKESPLVQMKVLT